MNSLRSLPARRAAILTILLLAAAVRPGTAGAQEVRPLHVGQQAPALSLPTFQEGSFDLASAAGQGPVVVVFQRGWVGYW